MNRGKFLLSLVLNKQQKEKIINLKKLGRVPAKRRKLQLDPSFKPPSNSTSTDSEDSDDLVEKEPSGQTTKKITIISDVLVTPPISAEEVGTTSQLETAVIDNNNEAITIAEEVIRKILSDVEATVLQQHTLEHTLTKDGKPRKRRKYLQSLKERKANKQKKLEKLHTIEEACNSDTCLKKCQDKISREQRVVINEGFWRMANQDQRSFILNSISKTYIKRKTTEAPSRRKSTMIYSFKDENGSRVEVCKTFFLTTLGFKKTNDKFVRSVFTKTARNAILPETDGRGKPNNKKFDREMIIKHIESFKPNIAHYRREHAPLRRYLPSDITIKSMYEDFKEKHPNIHFSYYLYREVVSSLNISFAKLGHEECFTCEVFSKHLKDSSHQKDNLNQECNACRAWSEHHEKYKSARAEYQKDCAAFEAVVTVDLQKVIMLPRCDTFKEVIFVPRLVAYNESFIPGGKRMEVPPTAIVWHEATAGRTKQDIISAFYKYFLQIRDVQHVILWADNCSAQNKNWCLYSFFVYLVNCDEVALNYLELKYFESGHTFMAADAFHHAVENSLKKKGKIYDFDDYVEAVKNSYKGVNVTQMSVNSFYEWEDLTSQYKLNKITPRPYLSSMVHVTFKRGERTMSYSHSFEGPSITLNFLNHKNFKTGITLPKCKVNPRGISNTRKQTIISRLGPIFPNNRLKFWENLPTTEIIDPDESD